MPRGRKKKSEPVVEPVPDEPIAANNEAQTKTDEPEEESQEETSFVTNDRVFWLRNVIRAQARDILQEMLDTKWNKLDEDNTFLHRLEGMIKSETASLIEKLNELTDVCKKKQRRIEKLEYENCQKNGEIKNLKLQLDRVQQERYDHNLQLVGLPEGKDKNDDIKQIVKLSKEKLGIKLKSSDLKEVTRLGKKNEAKTRNVLVKFQDKALRDKIYESRKKSITNPDPKKNTYINDQLTNHRQNLLFAARKLAKTKKIFAAWAQNGNILIRKSENGKIIEIHDHSDLRDFRDKCDSQQEIEVFRGSTTLTPSGSLSDILSIVTHISDYDFYVDSDTL